MPRPPAPPPACALALLLLCLLVAAPLHAEVYIWVDEKGITHFGDVPRDAAPGSDSGSDSDSESESELATDAEVPPFDTIDELRAVWGRNILGVPLATPRGASSSDADRALRLLRGAVEDLRRGETARANATLLSVIRTDPRNAEAHWYLALLDRQRGRYASSERHLRSFLSAAGNRYPDWRESAERRLASLGDERRLADPLAERGPLRFVNLESINFRLQVDAELSDARPGYGDTALDYLEAARREVAGVIGVTSAEPLGVVFYGKAAYQRAHAHRFSFQTVGFFDGRIHVSSPAHPSGGLRSLLYHEYAHAIFREQTGGDRPYWLNEGLAEHIERLSRSQPASIRSERASLRTRIEAGQWIPLRRLGPSFSGLSDDDARAAYLQSIIAVSWLDARTTREERARLLARLGEGFSIDQALHEMVGVDAEGLDAAIQADILGEFPSMRQ